MHFIKKPRPCFYLCRSCEANWFFLFLLFSFHCFFSFHFLLSHTKPIIKVKLIGLFNQRRKASAKHNISPLLFFTSAALSSCVCKWNVQIKRAFLKTFQIACPIRLHFRIHIVWNHGSYMLFIYCALLDHALIIIT